jgi:broad specificity phosphatase PhoE
MGISPNRRTIEFHLDSEGKLMIVPTKISHLRRIRKILLCRHGESRQNTRELDSTKVGDRNIPLTPHGYKQAALAGQRIGSKFFDDARVYCSPLRRTRETLAGIYDGAAFQNDPPIKPLEDPRLRELEHGYETVDTQEECRQIHGSFWYRYAGGESPADVYDRISTFLESFSRQTYREPVENVLIVTHGIAILCFVMRFLHMSVEQYEQMIGPGNCDIVTLAPKEQLDNPVFTSGRWGVEGLRLRSSGGGTSYHACIVPQAPSPSSSFNVSSHAACGSIP